jgi:hypothetical protein
VTWWSYGPVNEKITKFPAPELEIHAAMHEGEIYLSKTDLYKFLTLVAEGVDKEGGSSVIVRSIRDIIDTMEVR